MKWNGIFGTRKTLTAVEWEEQLRFLKEKSGELRQNFYISFHTSSFSKIYPNQQRMEQAYRNQS